MSKTPTPEQFKSFLDEHNIDHKQAAELLVDYSPRAIRSYYTAKKKKSARRLPYPVWYTLHHKLTGNPPKE